MEFYWYTDCWLPEPGFCGHRSTHLQGTASPIKGRISLWMIHYLSLLLTYTLSIYCLKMKWVFPICGKGKVFILYSRLPKNKIHKNPLKITAGLKPLQTEILKTKSGFAVKMPERPKIITRSLAESRPIDFSLRFLT